MSTNPLEKLAIDYWYKAILVAGLVILLLSLTVNIVNINNNIVQLISLGAFLIGLGEWANHPLQTSLMSATARYPGGKITGHPRKFTPMGILLDIIGIFLVVIGVYKLVA